MVDSSIGTVGKLPRATLRQKIEVLDYLVGPPAISQMDTVKHFKNIHLFAISQATLSNWVTHEEELRKEFKDNPNLILYKKKPVLKYPDVTKHVEKYVSELISNGETVTDKIIRDLFAAFMVKLGYTDHDFKLSGGMLNSFKRRNVLKKPAFENDMTTNAETLNLNGNNLSTISAPHRHLPGSTPPGLDFNFDEIFSNNTIGFNTRLIHSDDIFSLFPNSSNLSHNYNLGNGNTSLDLNTISPSNPKLSPLLTTSTTILNDSSSLPISNTISTSERNIANTESTVKDKTSKRKLPYYPTYQNPLNDNSYYKRHNQSFTDIISSKLSNPNSEKIEKILENITDGHVTLYNSGTSAIMGVLSFLNPMTVYIDEEGYKGTHNVIKLLNKLTGVKKISLTELSKENHKIPENSVIIIESPMNPLGYVHDISSYSAIAKSSKTCKLIVDSTLAPPPLQFPFNHGADYVVYSAVKYLAGVSDLGAGFIVSRSTNSKKILHSERSALGTSIANFDSFLLVRSLRTYKMRILTQCNNTEKIINYLGKNFEKYCQVLVKVHHASLQHNKDIVMTQLSGYYNPVFALELKNEIIPKLLLNKFNYLSNNPNLEGGETVVELIHGNNNFNISNDDIVSHRQIPGKNYEKMLRFSVGCEDFQDIIRDMDQALLSVIKNFD